MKQSDRHRHGKVIRVSGNALQKLDARRGELSYTQFIEELLEASPTEHHQRRYKPSQSGLIKKVRAMLRKVRFTDISIGD